MTSIIDFEATFFKSDGHEVFSIEDEKYYREKYHGDGPEEIEFCEFLAYYLLPDAPNKYFFGLVVSYIRLCENKIGIDYKHVIDIESLDAVVKLFFKQRG